MKSNSKLIAITVVFVFAGLLLSFISWRDSDFLNKCEFNNIVFSAGEELLGYKEGSVCICAEGGFVECLPLDVEFDNFVETDVSVSMDDLEDNDLKFEYNYLTGFAEGNGGLALNTTFTKIAIVEDQLIVVLEQMQVCPSTNVVFEQEGFYENLDGMIKLYNDRKEESGIDCIVELKYTLENLGELDLDKMQIVFVDSNGFENHASMCIYGNSVYSDDDVFKGSEDTICICEAGEVKCDTKLSD